MRLMIAPGATVSEGQAVMELETDKAVVEVPSSVSGKVKEILVKEGEKIKVGQVIFTVDNHGAARRWPRLRTRRGRLLHGVPAPQAVCCWSKPQGSIVPPPQRPSGEPTAAVNQPPAATLHGAIPSGAAAKPIDGCRGAPGIPAAGTRRKYFGGRSGALDDRPGRESFRRPAGDGTGNRQGRG